MYESAERASVQVNLYACDCIGNVEIPLPCRSHCRKEKHTWRHNTLDSEEKKSVRRDDALSLYRVRT